MGGVCCREEIEKSHFKHIAKMDKTLKGIPKGNRSMRDNILILYLSCFVGAHHDGQKDWPFVIVEGMAKKLKMGQHLKF